MGHRIVLRLTEVEIVAAEVAVRVAVDVAGLAVVDAAVEAADTEGMVAVTVVVADTKIWPRIFTD